MLEKVGVALEKTAVSVANHAKSDHQRGKGHGMGRYENQTTTLTRSIRPLLTRIDYNGAEAIVFTNVEYAAKVEAIYPYLFPALQAKRGEYMDRLKGAGFD